MTEQPVAGNRSLGWHPTQHALEQARQTYAEILPPVNLAGLTGWLTVQLQRGMSDEDEHCRLFADALYEISRLLEELRFEVSLASVYITEFDDKPHPGPIGTDGLHGSFEVPRTAMALLSPALEGGRLLDHLFADPGASIAGRRTVAGWFAAQLLDSALLRGVAALDCVTVLLWSAAGVSVSADRDGNLILPVFCTDDLGLVAFKYAPGPAWSSLCKLTEHRYMQLVRSRYDGFIHQRRMPMKLHGGREVAIRFGGEQPTVAMSAKRQLAMVSNFTCSVLNGAIAYTCEILSAAPRLPVRQVRGAPVNSSGSCG